MPYTVLSVLLNLLYLGWPEVLVNGVIGVVYTCHFKRGSNVTGLCMPSDTRSMVYWEIVAEANILTCTFCMVVDCLLNGHVKVDT